MREFRIRERMFRYDPNKLVLVLKAFLDDSGSLDDDCSFLCMAGYAATAENWEKFEASWQSVLTDCNVPYLHMKEFGDPNGLYKEIKANPKDERVFVERLIDVIRDCECVGFGASVNLSDLKQFNSDNDLNLDAYAVAVYFAIRQLGYTLSDEGDAECEVFLDKFERANHRWALALDLLKSDFVSAAYTGGISGSPIPDSQSARTVLPLQAADFLAWEMRKNCEEALGWTPNKDVRWNGELLQQDYMKWAESYTQANGKRPRKARGSILALANGIEVGSWGVVLLDDLNEVNRYHLNGWPQ